MKRKKIFAAIIVVFVLSVFASLAYSKDPGNGVPFRRLEERIGQNEFDIMELNEQINALQAQINALQGPQAILVYGEGSFYYTGTPSRFSYDFDKAVIVPLGEEEESGDGAYLFSLIIASEHMYFDDILDDPMDGFPQGWGDALWINIYSSSETRLEPGIYDYQERVEDGPQNPNYQNSFTFDDLMLIADFLDYDDEYTMFYITYSGTIEVIETVNGDVQLLFDVWLEEEADDEDNGGEESLVIGHGTGDFTYIVPSP